MCNNRSAAAQGLVIAALFLLGGYSLPAADLQLQSPQADIVVLIDPVQKRGEAFRQLIADAARYKLQGAGLRTEIVATSEQDTAKPVLQAQRRGAAAAVVCRYGVEGQQMDVSLGWYDTKAGTPAATVTTTGQVNLNLDNTILAAFEQMLDEVRDRVQAISSGHAPDQPLPAAQPQGAVTPGVIVVTPAPGLAPASIRPVPGRTSRILLSGGFAPFVPAGAASYYFSLGYLPSLLASIFVDTPMGPLGLGLYAGMDYFLATGTQDYADTFLVPLGLDVRYELGNATLRPLFHVAGGPALLIMATGTQGTISSVLPFVKSGIGLEVMVAQNVGISALADYDVYFEAPYLLMGFSPSVNMELHL